MTTRREFLKTSAAVSLTRAFSLGAAGAAAAGVLGFATPLLATGMQFRDEPVSYWLEQWRNPARSSTFGARFEAGSALASVGSAMMPALIERLADPARKQAARMALSDAADVAVPALLEAVAGRCRKTRESAARALHAMAAMSKILREPLLAVLRDPSPTVRICAAALLLTDGVAPNLVRPVLLDVLEHGDEQDRCEAVIAASSAKSNAMSSIFQAAVADREPSVRTLAAQSILELNPWRHDLIPLLVEVIKTHDGPNSSRFTRDIAGFALSGIDPAGQAVLRELLNDADARIACSALGYLTLRDEAIQPVLAQCLDHPRAEVRRQAALAFKSKRSDLQAAAQLLVKPLTDAHASVRKAAVEVLRYIGGPPELVATVLCPLLDDAAAGVRLETAIALAQFGSANQKAVHVLLAALPALILGPFYNSKFSCVAHALEQCHAEFARVSPILFTALEAGVDPGIRLRAVEALHTLWLPDAEAIQMFAEMMEDDMNPSADSAAYLLKTTGQAGRARLIAALGHRSKHVRKRAVQGIGYMSRKDADMLPVVAGSLSDESAIVREAAAHVLGEMAFYRTGPRLRPCVSFLAHALGDRDIAVRAAAAFALRRFGAAAESAIPCLETARNDPAQVVRSNAEATLAEIRQLDQANGRKA